MASAAPAAPGQKAYRPYGTAETVFYCKEKEILVSGPAGTGKSRGILEKLHLCAEKYAGMRGLILRKTRASLTQSALKTFEQDVVPEGHPIIGRVQRESRRAYRYPNGSEIVVGGLDNPVRVMSTDYDMAYIQEAVETEEDDWEKVTTRLRNGRMPYQQLLADTNPDSPQHYLYLRAQNGQTLMLQSRHEENPMLWDQRKNQPTPQGAAYLATLDALTGVRYKRLRLGLWVAAEGSVYEEWDPARHLIYGFDIPPSWPRYVVVDFGYTNPFCCQWWAQDPDGRLYRYREIYHTGRLVEDHAAQIKGFLEREPKPAAILCDWDAEDRATLERYLGCGVARAFKDVSPGIQAVATRLRVQGDERPRLFLLRDALVEKDPMLLERKKPTGTEEEFPGYVWNLNGGRKKGEEPVKQDDHGLDCVRYLVAYVDRIGGRAFRPAFAAGKARAA